MTAPKIYSRTVLLARGEAERHPHHLANAVQGARWDVDNALARAGATPLGPAKVRYRWLRTAPGGLRLSLHRTATHREVRVVRLGSR